MTLAKPSALAAGLKSFVLLTRDGEVFETSSAAKAAEKAGNAPVLICNRALTESKTGGVLPAKTLDLLELFAFACPAVKCTPTAKEMARFLKLPAPVNMYEEAQSLLDMTRVLFKRLSELPADENKSAAALAASMMRFGNWSWGADVLAALGEDITKMRLTGLSGFAAWDALTEWTETPPAEPAGTLPVLPDEAARRLAEMLNSRPENAKTLVPEKRPEQTRYAKLAATAFNPRSAQNAPVCVLGEAGTGVGKTLGYLAGTGLWCERNAGSVWISTYTRNLQRQLDEELSRVFSSESQKRKYTVIRKGRENYLCLLNYAEAVGRIQNRPASAIALGLVARWIRHTRDGDVNGGDFPSWLSHMLGERSVSELADKRGECIYAQCPHFRKCFVEKVSRRTRQAKIVIANHAFVMTQLAGAGDEQALPTRYIFDEAHQIFNAADNIFCAEISGFSGVEMRRWLLGTNDVNSRVKGLKRRLEDVILLSPDAAAALDDVLESAAFLPRFGVQNRLQREAPETDYETFLCAVRRQVYTRNDAREKLHSLECAPAPALPDVEEAAKILQKHITRLSDALTALKTALEKYMNDNAADLSAHDKQRLDGTARSLEKNALDTVAVWNVMLRQLNQGAPEDFVDWFEVGRSEGTEVDAGYYRHWVDPTFPFAKTLACPAQGVLMTSATLKDRTDDEQKSWQAAMLRTGAVHLNPSETVKESVASPFDYAANSRVFILTDVNKNDIAQIAAASRELFLASNGGALGVFTAISRLKAVYKAVKKPLNDAGLLLLAQHIDALDLTTLLDIFKAEEESCLLGTDAVRDGIDVPGKSLRLLMFDRVPWERPTIAHKCRRLKFEENGGDYNMMLARMKLAQAFGRLIRKKDDRGVFVLLDKAVPSETLTAFPEGAPVEKIGLKDALIRIREFLGTD